MEGLVQLRNIGGKANHNDWGGTDLLTRHSLKQMLLRLGFLVTEAANMSEIIGALPAANPQELRKRQRELGKYKTRFWQYPQHRPRCR
jgi:hypothetical protein